MMDSVYCEIVLTIRDDALKHLHRKRTKIPVPDQHYISPTGDSELYSWEHILTRTKSVLAKYLTDLFATFDSRSLQRQYFCLAIKEDSTIDVFGADTDNAFNLRITQDFMFDWPIN